MPCTKETRKLATEALDALTNGDVVGARRLNLKLMQKHLSRTDEPRKRARLLQRIMELELNWPATI